ncbi:MAG TPA: HDIG domain-containing protein, partial [Methanolinea sp.]|nr:HDIG domain-containing protein [Methanolinea sp.]
MEKTENARQLLEQYVSGESLIRHCLACGAIMKKAAGTLGEDEARFETIGILHDIDFEVVDGDMERHGIEGARILLENGYGKDVTEVVKKHNDMIFGSSEGVADVVLQAADNISGLIIACALVKGGSISEVTPKTVKKKFQEKSFAAGCRREKVREIEEFM